MRSGLNYSVIVVEENDKIGNRIVPVSAQDDDRETGV